MGRKSTVTQELFHAISDPTRRDILELLSARQGMSATEIYEEFSMSHPAVSQHLSVLLEADLVNYKKDAQKHIYSLNPKRIFEIEDWATQLTELWDSRFEKLDEVLKSEKRKLHQGK